MAIQKARKYSVEEYIAIEDNSEIKHEYERGEVLAMSGGTMNHARLCQAMSKELDIELEKNSRNCETFGSELRIFIEKADCIVYPDASVFCEPCIVSGKEKNSATNPMIVVEVLSKSTESYDRGDKFFKYRQLDSLQEYILISQNEAKIESFVREKNGAWQIYRTEGLDAELEVSSLGLALKMGRIYRHVIFESEEG